MFTVTVTETAQETAAVKVLRLARSDGRPLAPYAAGAHIDVTGPTGVTRPYSLCGPPGDIGFYTIAVKREENSRGGSLALHDKVTTGTELLVGEPRRLFGVVPQASEHHLVAAGIGITPLLAMAYELHAAGAEFRLHYVARDRSEAALAGLLEEAAFADRVTFHFGLGRAGTTAVLADELTGLPAQAHVYTCGPPGFMEQTAALAGRGLPADHIHSELFQAGEQEDAAPCTSFEVELDTGEVFTVPPDRSIADVLEANGVAIDTSCREGICGTCVLQVLSGDPDHRDHCLTAKEKAAGDQIAACVSRSRSPRLVVELW
ncbi:PDR/VanB family oxidoreductase [Streptomyces sp. NPDC090052]|uniref:PDR/VanB family oxidoreductase n=1 Tax=unclassified Streptomyces TaxID=2593676 RepID=UPI0022515442|nr:PDR/VanB family oxidoreductase [Streptomyces sp. NBC_01306]MCX4728093.1 PDR/VanB family oxidoreductase [Streptomyces sp. NBC_01306]WSX40751.1 PDR/VanB family oxidoreductase [Streptomyces sp. NBC_00963]